MTKDELISFLGKEKYEEIESKAKSFIRGRNRYNVKGFNSYIQKLSGEILDKKIIDAETGEIVDSRMFQIPAVIVARNAYFEKKTMVEEGVGKDERGHHFNIKRGFSFSLEKKLTLGDRDKIAVLLNNQFKHYDFDRNEKKWYSPQDLDLIWKVNKNAGNNLRSKLSKFGVLESRRIKGSNKKEYRLSQQYCYMGSSDGEKHQKIFFKKWMEITKKTKEEERKYEKNHSTKLKYSSMAILLAILPYFHEELCYLVNNPTERVVQRGESLLDAFERESELQRSKKKLMHKSINSLREILGTNKQASKTTVTTYMNLLQISGAVMKTKTKETRYLIHPDLSLSKNLNHDDPFIRAVKAFFNM